MKVIPTASFALLVAALAILPGCKKVDTQQQDSQTSGDTSQAAQSPKTNADGMKDNNFKYCIDGALYMLNKNTWVATPIYESAGGSTPTVKACPDTQLYSDDLPEANN